MCPRSPSFTPVRLKTVLNARASLYSAFPSSARTTIARALDTETFFKSAKIKGLPLRHITEVPLKSNSILEMSTSISSLSRSAMTTTVPPPKLSLAIAS
nr:hypothetical protein Iba_chr15dCG3860 [Ipomoea batatas]GME00402.1 hypothetical protein Iba_chr15fCG5060 [Ipomoea batatas]